MKKMILRERKYNAVLYLVITFSTALLSDDLFISEEIKRTFDTYNVLQINRKPNQDAVHLAVKSLSNGKIIAVPTDTVYGLAIDAAKPRALEILYRVLQKPYYEPVVMCVPDVGNVSSWGVTKRVNDAFLSELFRLPVTVMLPRTQTVYEHINPGNAVMGFRVPKKMSFLQRVIKHLGRPLILTSARWRNRSNSIEIDEFRELWNEVEFVFNDNKLNKTCRIGSTVVDLSIIMRYIFVRRGVACSEVQNLCERYHLSEIPYFPPETGEYNVAHIYEYGLLDS